MCAKCEVCLFAVSPKLIAKKVLQSLFNSLDYDVSCDKKDLEHLFWSRAAGYRLTGD